MMDTYNKDELTNYIKEIKEELEILDEEELEIPTSEGTIYLGPNGNYEIDTSKKGEPIGIFPKALEKIIKDDLKKHNSDIEP
jgi:hypothetical protein